MIHELGASLKAALGSTGSPELASLAAEEVPFTKTVRGSLRDLPRAARTVWDVLDLLLQKNSGITVTDRFLAKRCGVGRRCVQKGLAYLEHVKGWIVRWRHNGKRTIYLKIKWPKKKSPVKAGHAAAEEPASLYRRVSSMGWQLKVALNSPAGVQLRPIREDAVDFEIVRTAIRGREQDLRAYILANGRPART